MTSLNTYLAHSQPSLLLSANDDGVFCNIKIFCIFERKEIIYLTKHFFLFFGRQARRPTRRCLATCSTTTSVFPSLAATPTDLTTAFYVHDLTATSRPLLTAGRTPIPYTEVRIQPTIRTNFLLTAHVN